jgi:K(+)-stimulated pyrophosphate-energized sodium pump
MMAFVFCAMTMKAVGRAAGAMVDELEGNSVIYRESSKEKENLNMQSVLKFSTKGAQKEMLLPALLAIIVPVAIGILL